MGGSGAAGKAKARREVILGIEASTHAGGAALLRAQWNQFTQAVSSPDPEGLVGSINFSTRQLYSQRLLPSIQCLLDRTQVETDAIKLIGVAIGPGSFTGLRIGLSVAKALAFAADARIIGVGTLEALAVRASGGKDGVVCPVLDARHGQVYAGLYEVTWVDGWPLLKTLRDDWAGPVQELAGWISQPTVFAGDAMQLLFEQLRPNIATDHFLRPALNRNLPHAEEVALLTAARARAGHFDDLVALEPRYVRQSYTSGKAGQ